MQQPPSPPLYSLGDAREKWALESRSPSDLGGDGRSLSQNAARGRREGGGGSRPRSATEGVAGGADGSGGERGRSLFTSDRDTRRCVFVPSSMAFALCIRGLLLLLLCLVFRQLTSSSCPRRLCFLLLPVVT